MDDSMIALSVIFIVTVTVSLMTKAEVNPFNDNPAEEAKGSA